MSSKSVKQVQLSMGAAVDLFVKLIEKSQQDGTINVNALGAAAQAIKKFPPFQTLVQEQHNLIHRVVSDEVLSSRRSNFFGRLMLETVAPFWKSGDLNRTIIPNLLSFFRLVLGDEEEHYSNQCQEIVADLRQVKGDDFDWDDYHADPRAKVILYRVLVRIAQSFSRFDARRDWFIKLMQYEPSAISIASNAFVPTGQHSPSQASPFTAIHFNILMKALFEPVRQMTSDDEMLFVRELSMSRAKAFGTLFSNMARSSTL